MNQGGRVGEREAGKQGNRGRKIKRETGRKT